MNWNISCPRSTNNWRKNFYFSLKLRYNITFLFLTYQEVENLATAQFHHVNDYISNHLPQHLPTQADNEESVPDNDAVADKENMYG